MKVAQTRSRAELKRHTDIECALDDGETWQVLRNAGHLGCKVTDEGRSR
jgi:hypothetical protein